MNHLDAMLKDENQAARLLAEVHGDVLNAEVLERASAYEDPLLAYIKQEIIIPFGRLEAVEDSLFARIEQFVQNAGSHQADELINRAVASENPMLPGAVERLEQRIMERIDQEQFQKRVRVFPSHGKDSGYCRGCTVCFDRCVYRMDRTFRFPA